MNKKILKWVLILLLVIGSNFITFNAAIYGASLDQGVKIRFLENFVKKNYLYEVTDEQLEIGKLKGVVSGLNDPYSEYMTKKEYDKLIEMTSGKFFGIGVVITKGDDNLITVISPIKDSPADNAGIITDDKIIKVNGKEYTADKMDDAVAAMKGKKGTDVTITIYTPSTSKTRDVKLTRDEIKVETIIEEKIGDIGYIGITQFDETTSGDFIKSLENLEKKGVKGLILDLRGNPGGTVESAAKISDALLPEGMIVYAKDNNKKTVFEYKSDKNQTKLPLVVLINKGSASASEIVSGAIKDSKRGTIIGTTSFGKGIVQSVIRFPQGDGIKLTTSEYFTPSGKNIHKIGIKPDIEVKQPEGQRIGVKDLETDLQLKKGIEVLESKIK